jgi:hypothetical protein
MADRVIYWGMPTPRDVRLASLAVVAGFVVRFAVVEYPPPIWIALPLALATTVAGWPLLMWIALFAPGWRAVRPGELDEREIAERHRAFVLAYILAGVGLGATLVVGQIAVSRHWSILNDGRSFSNLIFSLLWAYMALPGIILAWRGRSLERSVI